MIAYTTIQSEDERIHFSMLIEEFEPGRITYHSPSISFKNDGVEIDFWDNPVFIRKILNLIRLERWDTLEKELCGSGVHESLTVGYFRENRESLVKLSEFDEKIRNSQKI